MYCPRCGQVNGDGSTACGACQTPLDPNSFQGRAAVPEVPNYLATSILVTLCCCLPAGIPALVYAVQSNSCLETGDYVKAREKAQLAYTWSWVAFGMGLVVVVLRIVASVAANT